MNRYARVGHPTEGPRVEVSSEYVSDDGTALDPDNAGHILCYSEDGPFSLPAEWLHLEPLPYDSWHVTKEDSGAAVRDEHGIAVVKFWSTYPGDLLARAEEELARLRREASE